MFKNAFAAAIIATAAAAHPLQHSGLSRMDRGLKARVSVDEADMPPDLWYTQKVDHFDYTRTGTWAQRYQMNSTWATEGGPVFLMLGGEGPASAEWLVADTEIMVNAEQFGATVIQLEHRFYGDSQPTGDLTTESLGLLSSQQALADAAAFVTGASDLYGLTGPWVAFGGSYSGNLAAWLRLKYPHIVAGAIGWSAPVLAEVDFTQYMDVVSDGIALVSEDCLSTVAAGTALVHDLLAQQDFATVEKEFGLCAPLDGKLDRQNFMATITGAWADGAQYGHDNRGFEGGDPVTTLEQLCEIVEAAADPLSALVGVNDRFMSDMGMDCLDVSYDAMIAEMADTTLAAGAGRSWTWQTCSQFAYYQSSDSTAQPFGVGFPIEFWTEQCPEIFDGVQVNQATVDFTNAYYGATEFKGTNVVLPNGSQDPWHALGVVAGTEAAANLPESSIAVDAGHVAHCAGMYPADDSDPEELRAARETVTQTLKSWLE